MTVVAKRIKTLFLTSGGSIAAGVDLEPGIGDSHTWLEDVTVVGVHLRSTLLDAGTGWDSGRFSCGCELSRTAVYSSPGVIASFCNHLICREATVGINANQTMVGKPEERETVMFPEGYGIDMNEDAVLYLLETGKNEMANPHDYSISAIVYYVER